MSDVSEAFYVAVQAIASVIPAPLPVGISQATVGDWSLTINTADEPVAIDGIEKPILPFEIYAKNNKYLAFAVIGPSGGAIGGMTEEQFIADLAPFGAA